MKKKITSVTLSKFNKPLAGLFVLMALSVQLVAQQPYCNAHFYHYSFNSMNVNFYASINHPATTYAWNFGDGGTSTQRNPAHMYLQPGAYYVCLTVTRNGIGGTVLCTSTICDSVHVTLPPPPPPPVCNAHFFHHSIWHSASTYFVAALNPPGSTYLWDFGDGNTATVRDTNYTYAQPGTYFACLTVTKTDLSGNVLCTDHWCDSVHVAPPPPLCNAHFFTSHRGHHLNVRFVPAFNPAGVTYAWDFGDGQTSTAHFPLHTYAQAGDYNACLTVTKTDTAGVVICTATWCDSVFIDTTHFCHQWHPCNQRMSSGAETNSVTNATATVFPNPVTENSVLHIANMTGHVTLRIFENTGRLVSLRENLANGDYELNKNDLGSGLYLYQISDVNGNVLKGKLIVE